MAIQPVPVMTPVPHFPALSERAAGTYNASAYNFGTHLSVTFNGELLAVADNVRSNALEAKALADAAHDSAQESATSAGAALAATAFKGPWVNLSGALPVPATVWDQSQYWVLLQPLADVAAVRPGTDKTKWAPLIAGVAPAVEITANSVAQPGLRYLLSAPGITLTLPASFAKGEYIGFVDMVGDRSCKVDFNGHKFRGRAVGIMEFDIPLSGGGGVYEDASKGLV